jgi:regulator of sigma E protease
VNFVVAFVLLFVFYSMLGPHEVTGKIGAVQKGWPAAGKLKPGDKVVAVDGRPGTPVQLSQRIATHKCPGAQVQGCKGSPVKVTVLRDGKRVAFMMTPVYDPAAKKVRVGFAYDDNGPRQNLSAGKSLDTTVDQFWFITRETVKLPAYIFNAQKRHEISGIVGVSDTTHKAISNDAGDAIFLFAVISLSLAIINLFPFLPLDGGHIFWAAVEFVRRRPVPYAVMERAGVLGFMLVLGLFLLGLTNDIDRLTSGTGPR